MDAIDFEREFPEHQPQILAIAAGLQKLILSIFPTAEITLDEENVGYGFGRGYKDLVFVITPCNKHVNLGIVNGAALADPNGLLQGNGKIHRHVKLRKIEMVSDPDLADLMDRALNAAQKRIQQDA
jgi:hypothetical protein